MNANLRHGKDDVIGKGQCGQHQHRSHAQHVLGHLVVQLQFATRQRPQSLLRCGADARDLQEAFHVVVEVLDADRKDAVHFHGGREFLLQHLVIVLDVVDVAIEHVAAHIFADLMRTVRGGGYNGGLVGRRRNDFLGGLQRCR